MIKITKMNKNIVYDFYYKYHIRNYFAYNLDDLLKYSSKSESASVFYSSNLSTDPFLDTDG